MMRSRGHPHVAAEGKRAASLLRRRQPVVADDDAADAADAAAAAAAAGFGLFGWPQRPSATMDATVIDHDDDDDHRGGRRGKQGDTAGERYADTGRRHCGTLRHGSKSRTTQTHRTDSVVARENGAHGTGWFGYL